MPSKKISLKPQANSYIQNPRRAKAFQTGGSTAVRIPKDFDIADTDDLTICKVADGILISRAPRVATVADWWGSWEADPTFMPDGRQQPVMQVRDF